MKKFSLNLLKVGMLLIIGLCIMGAMSSVNAGEIKIEADNLIKEKNITLNVNESYNIEISWEMCEMGDNQKGMKLGDDMVYLSDFAYMVRKFETEGKFVSVSESGRVTAKNPGTEIVKFKVIDARYEGVDGGEKVVYYDEIKITVEDNSETSEVLNNPGTGEEETIDSEKGTGLKRILDIVIETIIKAIRPILQAIVNPFVNKVLQTILP